MLVSVLYPVSLALDYFVLLCLLLNKVSTGPGCGRTLLCPIRLLEIHAAVARFLLGYLVFNHASFLFQFDRPTRPSQGGQATRKQPFVSLRSKRVAGYARANLRLFKTSSDSTHSPAIPSRRPRSLRWVVGKVP